MFPLGGITPSDLSTLPASSISSISVDALSNMSPNTVNGLTVDQLNGLSVSQVSALINSPNIDSFSSTLLSNLNSLSKNQQLNQTSGSGVTTTTSNPNNGFKLKINLISLVFCFFIFRIFI